MLLSPGDVATTRIPPPTFSMVNEPYTLPVILSTVFTDILSALIIKSTNKIAFTFIYPPPAIITPEPIVSLVDRPVKLKYPASEEKTVEEISGSFGS